jgi:predicted permease
MKLALWIYRLLAGAFPHEFKLVYGAEVTQLGEDILEEVAQRHGFGGLVRLVADIAVHIPLEYLSEMRGDFRYAARGLMKSPGFSLVGIVSLGIGIGLTTMIYDSKWQMFSRELPAAANAKRLAMPEKPVSYYYIEQYRAQKSLFTGVTAFQTGVPFNVTLRGDVSAKPERVFGQLVSADYFSVLGVRAQRGRVLSAGLDKPGDAPVVVISDRFWRNRLNSSPDAVGQTLRLNGQVATIVGITPANFNGAVSITPAELFVPVTVPAALAPELANDVLHRHDAREFLAMLCLAPGVTVGSAEAALDAITRHLDEQDPSAPAPTDKGRRVTLLEAGTMVPLPRNLKAVVKGFCAALMGLIMIIACTNLANMFLARGANRRKELAIRVAVGASRFRMVRQMAAESILLSLLGGVAGFALAYWLYVWKSRFAPAGAVPEESGFAPDWHAAAFVLAIAFVCGIGLCLGPALRAMRTDLTPALKESSAFQLPRHRRFGLRNVLMVSQLSGSVMLLLVTGFLVLGLSHVGDIEMRFDPHSMYLLSLDPVREGYTAERANALFAKLPEQLKAAGRVRGVALAAQPPYTVQDEDEAIRFTVQDSRGASRVQISAVEETVGAGYFAALEETMLEGHEFEPRRQGDGSKPLATVLNESAARGLFGNGNAIGERFKDDRQSYEVVGVVRDLKNGVAHGRSVIYLPLTPRDFARPPAGGITVMVRSDGGSEALSEIRREIASMYPDLTVFNAQTLSDYLERSRSSERFAVSTYTGIGVFSLVLSAVGLAGVTAYAVAQRRKEIAIRMALGARKGQVLLLVLREGAALVSAGTIFGLAGALCLAKMLSALTSVFVEALKVGTNDLRLLAGLPLLLAGLALFACYVPARRAAGIDPLKSLRQG